MWTGLDAQRIQNPVKQPTDGIETAQTVFFFGEKHIVVGLAIAHGGLVCQQCFVHTHRLRQADGRCFVAFDFRRCQAQIMEFAVDDFDVFVFQLPHVTWSQKGIDHEPDQAVHFKGHAAVLRLDMKPRVRLVPDVFVVSQSFGLTQYGRVFGDGERPARLLRDFHFGEQGHLRNMLVFNQMAQHFAQLRDVAHDGGR